MAAVGGRETGCPFFQTESYILDNQKYVNPATNRWQHPRMIALVARARRHFGKRESCRVPYEKKQHMA
jgi:hypothetical protein